jgi:hypothetical protein
VKFLAVIQSSNLRYRIMWLKKNVWKAGSNNKTNKSRYGFLLFTCTMYLQPRIHMYMYWFNRIDSSHIYRYISYVICVPDPIVWKRWQVHDRVQLNNSVVIWSRTDFYPTIISLCILKRGQLFVLLILVELMTIPV